MAVFRTYRIIALGMAVCLLGTSCSRQGEDAGVLRDDDGLLRYVPADTPYLLVTPGDLPEDLADKLEPQVDAALKAYGTILRAAIGNPRVADDSGGTDGPDPLAIEPFVDGLSELMSVQGLRDAGVDRNSDLAFYGVGLVPVFRVSLSDGELMEAAIADLETRAGEKMNTASIGNADYRYVGDDETRFIVAVFGDELVLSIVPGQLNEPLLRRVLGVDLPEQNIARTGVLAEVAEQHGFRDYMIGMIDVERLAETFLHEQSGINAELHRLLGYETSEISDVCKAELAGLAGITPRLVTGYTDLNVSRIASKLVIELRQDIAAGVAGMVGAVPGLGAHSGGLMSFGVGIDLMASREFYAAQLQKLDEEPFQCELLADVQSEVSAGRAALNSPVPPIVYGIRGFLAEISSLEGGDIANGVPPTALDLRMILATDNAEGLIAMGAMFSPELMAMNLEPDGEPVRIDMPQLQSTGQVVHLAMTGRALGVSVGEGMEQGLKDMLNAPVSEPQPFFAMNMDAARYYAMINEAMSRDESLDQLPEIKSAAADLITAAQEFLDRVSFAVNFSETGIEMRSEVLLQD